MEIFERLESEVRGYCRAFPTVFATARGSRLTDRGGRQYIDFFSGAGALNYGHNNPRLKEKLLDYLIRDGVLHSLDMATEAKAKFLASFEEIILRPRGMDYKIQFPGPTGTNAVEAALKLARKVTGRTTVVSFTNGYHGMTLGSLAVTGNSTSRAGAGVPLNHAAIFPFDGYLGPEVNTLDYLEAALNDPSSGLGKPAAVILETVQAEGGVNPASLPWLQGLARLLEDHGILLIIDDIQVGCGRTGPFFSFEAAGIIPDIVCLSKSISGYGLPMAIVLLRPELDLWTPGEHNGTFRGNNAAFVTAAEALEFWRDDTLTREVQRKEAKVRARLERWVEHYPETCLKSRGRGLIQGLVMDAPGSASKISKAAFADGLIIEVAGPRDEVLKFLPPLMIDDEDLETGLAILEGALARELSHHAVAATSSRA